MTPVDFVWSLSTSILSNLYYHVDNFYLIILYMNLYKAIIYSFRLPYHINIILNI